MKKVLVFCLSLVFVALTTQSWGATTLKNDVAGLNAGTTTETTVFTTDFYHPDCWWWHRHHHRHHGWGHRR
jgi:hypothetical protein